LNIHRITGFTLSLLATLVLSAATFVFSTTDAEARRLGGGRSFGARPAYSTPYQRVAPRVASRAVPRTAAAQKNAGLREQFSRRGGLMGLLGGLALGGLLGALFFGGAFEGINFLDVLVFAGIAFLLYKLFASRRRPAVLSGAGPLPPEQPQSSGPSRPTPAARRFDTDLLFGRNQANAHPSTPPRPAGFDETEFLTGAERAYRMLQEAWDTGDLETLRALTTPHMMAELERQARELPPQGRTEILRLAPELLEVRDEGGQWHAAVLFEADLAETDDHTGRRLPAQRVREVWHFLRPGGTDRPTWYLDGIQQVADDEG